MNQIETRIEGGAVADVHDLTGGLLSVIERAARDPSVDIDKMERLLEMQERVQKQRAETAFNVAMNLAQADMRPIAANASNPQTKSRYATFDKLDRVLRPIYTTQGFSLSFDEGDSPKPEHVRVVCYVSHVEGHTRTYHRDMPADGKGAKGGDVMTKTHAAGAAGSYGARYLLKGIFNVAVGEEDDDGNGGSAPPARPEPKRAPLKGAHKTRAALRDAIQRVVDEMSACEDADQLDAFLRTPEAKATVDQTREEHEFWWKGDGADFWGLDREIVEAYNRVSDGMRDR